MTSRIATGLGPVVTAGINQYFPPAGMFWATNAEGTRAPTNTTPAPPQDHRWLPVSATAMESAATVESAATAEQKGVAAIGIIANGRRRVVDLGIARRLTNR